MFSSLQKAESPGIRVLGKQSSHTTLKTACPVLAPKPTFYGIHPTASRKSRM